MFGKRPLGARGVYIFSPSNTPLFLPFKKDIISLALWASLLGAL